MKKLFFAVALVAGSLSVPAFAQTSAPGQPADSMSSAVAQGGQWASPEAQPPAMQKTRAQVYQELVQAERDGQLAYLNSAIYAHP